MNNQTIDNLEELANEAISYAKEKINDGENFGEACNQANNLVRTLNELRKSEKDENTFFDKTTIIEIAKISVELLSLIISLIGIRSYAKMVMKYEINDGRILSSSPGKGLSGLFRFKSFI